MSRANMARQATDDDPQNSGGESNVSSNVPLSHSPYQDPSDPAEDSDGSYEHSDTDFDSIEDDYDTRTREWDQLQHEWYLYKDENTPRDPYAMQRRDEARLDTRRRHTQWDGHDRPKPSDERLFTRFPQLPTEIRLMIWKLLIPNHRTFNIGILTIVNFDLSKPRTILTQCSLDSARALSMMFPRFMALLSLLHSCREARMLTSETYHLDLDSENKKPWWDLEDMIYFPFDLLAEKWYISPYGWAPESYKTCQQSAYIRHIAVDLPPLTLYMSHRTGGRSDLKMDVEWVKDLPLLESITFVLDPGFVRLEDRGTLVLYEAEDVPLTNYYSLRPSELEQRAKECVRDSLACKGRDMPSIELAVICLRSPKRQRLR